ncbi:MAG: M15 family metallopeptidase [Patescibacteria group bacterium]
MKLAIQISMVDFAVIEGARTIEKQREYFNAGKSRTMNSRHIPKAPADHPDWAFASHAVDLAPYLDTDGDGDTELSWEPRHFTPIVQAMKNAASTLKVPIVWGGDWTSFVDMPHFELDRKYYP